MNWYTQGFSGPHAHAARDAAIDAVDSTPTAADWRSVAEACVLDVADKLKTFTTDDVLRYHPQLEAIPEKRLLGAVMRALSGRKLTPLGYRHSTRVASHARPKRVWQRMPEEVPSCDDLATRPP